MWPSNQALMGIAGVFGGVVGCTVPLSIVVPLSLEVGAEGVCALVGVDANGSHALFEGHIVGTGFVITGFWHT